MNTFCIARNSMLFFMLAAIGFTGAPATAQFSWDGDCSILWHDCCMQGKNFVNNWAVQGNPSACPPTPGPNDSASISGLVDSQPYQINVAALSQTGTFLCRAQSLTIGNGQLTTFGSIFEPSTLQLLDGSIINVMPPSDVMNGSFCTIDVRNGYIRPIDPWKGTQLFTNQGTITKTGQPEVNSVISVALENQGLVTCESGTLVLSGGGTSSGQISVPHDRMIRLEGPWTDIGGEVAGQGTIWFAGGTYTITGNFHPQNVIILYGVGYATVNFNSNCSVDNLRLDNAGVLGGSGELTIDDFTWNGSPASMIGDGTTIITQSALLQGLYNNGACDLERDLEFAPTASAVEKPGTWFRLNSAEVRNYGDYEIQGNGNIEQTCCVANSGFKNYGTFRKTGGSISNISVLFSNVGGTVEVQSGTLAFNAQMATTGPIIVNSGAEVVLGHGDGQSVFPEGSITGGGTLRFSGGVLDQVEGTIDVPNIIIDYGHAKFQEDISTENLTMIEGSLRGIGDFIITDRLEWHNGEMRDEGITTVQGAMHLTNYAGLNRTLELDNAKAPVESGPGTLHLFETGSSLLRGNGTIGGNVNNRGTVSPGLPAAPIGVINITGDWQPYCCVGTTELLIDIDGPEHDRVNVSGNANLVGRLVVSGSPTPGQAYTIFTAANVSGGFGQVIAAPGTVVQYTPTSVIVHAPFGPPVLVNFDTYPDGSAVQSGEVFTDQWATVGVVFTDGAGGGPGPSGNSCSISPPNHAYAGSGLIVAEFVDPCTGEPSVTDKVSVRQDWCWASGEGIDVFAYDANGNEIGHQFSQGGGAAASFEFESQVIRRLHIYNIGQGIDDLTFTLPATSAEFCAADINENGVVNVADLLSVISAWGSCGLGICEADTNCDRQVNVSDLLAVISAWGSCPNQ